MTAGQPSQSIHNSSCDVSLVELSSLVKRWFHSLIFHLVPELQVSTMCQRQVASAAGRGIVGLAARAISVWVADMSNIAAAGSDLVLGKKVRHVGHRRCRHSHAAAQRGFLEN
jgi:hypothetical protein